MANRILARIGLALGYTRKQKSNGNVTRYYKLDEELAVDNDRQAVWEALNKRWEERKQKNAETVIPQGTDRGHIKNNFLYKNSSSVPQNKPEELPQKRVVQDTTERWKPEEVHEITEMLAFCQDVEGLELLKQSRIPLAIFKQAAEFLTEPGSRQWVLDWVTYWEQEQKYVA